MSRDIELIVIHCSDTPNGRVTTVQEIDDWHRARKFARQIKWRELQNSHLSSIGYHYVITAAGLRATGRHPDEIGGHAKGYNARSIGICMIGRDAFSLEQWEELRRLIEQLLASYPAAKVVGHCALNAKKTCPNFDVAAWMRDPAHLPPERHVYTPKEPPNA